MKNLFCAALCLFAAAGWGADKKIVLIAGNPSHGPGDHEHRAGMLLLQKSLQQNMEGLNVVVHSNGWVKSDSDFDGAAAIVIYSDGGGGHPAIKPERLKLLSGLMEKGVGLGCIHYAVEVPKDRGGKEFLDWIGGYFETYWSVNPHWTADFKELPKHPVTQGVKPFSFRDEWYYHMRFRDDMKGVTPILTAVPPDSTRGEEGKESAHGGNKHVQARKGQPEHVMWVAERENGGRGFGVTGAHFHKNWANDDYRKLVLNAIVWISKTDVPSEGVQSKITTEDMAANLDPKRK